MVTQVVSVTMSGWTGVQRMIRGMPSKARKEGKALSKRISEFIVRSAKQRVGAMKTRIGKIKRKIGSVPIKR